MSIKTEISSLIDTSFADASNITALEHRDALKDNIHSLLENLYPETQTDNEGSQSILNIGASNFTFNIQVCKQGRLVHLSGFITNNDANTTSLGTITPAELQPTTGIKYASTAFVDNTTPIFFGIIDGQLSVVSPLNNGETVRFNLTYKTQS